MSFLLRKKFFGSKNLERNGWSLETKTQDFFMLRKLLEEGEQNYRVND